MERLGGGGVQKQLSKAQGWCGSSWKSGWKCWLSRAWPETRRYCREPQPGQMKPGFPERARLWGARMHRAQGPSCGLHPLHEIISVCTKTCSLNDWIDLKTCNG